MRKVFRIRALVLACAITAMSVPLFNASNPASACSNPGCVVTATTTGQIETYVSPLTVTAITTTFAERATTSQVPSVTIPGSLSFTVLDARGNNEGFVASVSSSGFSSSLFPLLPITSTDILITSTPTVDVVCYGPGKCSPGVGLASSIGTNLASNPAVAVECPLESIGEGQYAATVPLSLTVTGLTAEKLGSYPASYFGSFTVSVAEGQPLSSFATYGCPAFDSSGW